MTTDSQIGYSTATLVDPVTYADSLIGYTQATLVDPTANGDSPIGFTVVALADPVLPQIMLSGVAVDVDRIMIHQSGTDVPVKRVKIMHGGVAVDLVAPAPPGDGFVPYTTIPDETNCGVYSPELLTPYTGTTTITTPTVLTNKQISTRISNRSQLVLINCLVDAVGDATHQAMIDNTNLNADLYAERCSFIPATLNYYTNSANGHNVHMKRCVVKWTVDGFSPYGNSVFSMAMGELECCVLGPFAWYAYDGGIHTDGTHNDGTQLHGGGFYRMHGCALHGYKYNVLGTPALDGSANNLYPEIGQLFLAQHTVGYIFGYLSSERALQIDGSGFPVPGSSGGAPIIDHNWFWGGDNGVKIQSGVYFGTQDGLRVDLAVWIFNNTWMDMPRLYGSYPYPIRIDTNVWLNGQKYPQTTGRGWYDTTSPSFDWNNRYGTDSSIPVGWQGTAVGVRVDAATASVARAV